MRYLCLTLSVFLIVQGMMCSDQKQDRLRILFLGNDESVLAYNQDAFWAAKGKHDTIDLYSESLVDYYSDKLYSLDNERRWTFDHRIAIIISKGESIDTLYTDHFLEYWHIRHRNYHDTTGYFRKVFFPIMNAR